MIRTVLGDIESGTLGPTDYHEHAFQASPLLAGDELDDENKTAGELAELRDSGFAAVIDATPVGLGRRPDALARLSESVGLTIIATTGAHRDAHYGIGHWLLDASEDTMADYFTHDVTIGMHSSDTAAPGETRAPSGGGSSRARSGVIKAGIDYWHISQFERRVLGAVAMVHRRTNAPVMVHLESCTAGFEVLDILGKEGVDADAVALAHVDRNPDPWLHADLAATGAYLGYDGFARAKDWPDSLLIETMIRTADSGGADRILIGGDVARRSRYRAYGGMPGLRYLGDRALPQLRLRAPDELVELVTRANPARYLDRFAPDAPEDHPNPVDHRTDHHA